MGLRRPGKPGRGLGRVGPKFFEPGLGESGPVSIPRHYLHPEFPTRFSSRKESIFPNRAPILGTSAIFSVELNEVPPRKFQKWDADGRHCYKVTVIWWKGRHELIPVVTCLLLTKSFPILLVTIQQNPSPILMPNMLSWSDNSPNLPMIIQPNFKLFPF